MRNKITFFGAICLGLALLGCGNTESRPLSIRFSADSTAIVISDIGETGLFRLKTNLEKDTAYQQLVSVLQTPAEDDSTGMETDWPGKLRMQGDSLWFVPANPFVKGKNYLVETMLNTQFASGGDIVRAKVGHTVKPQQQILVR
ncbi:hypothetical protein VRU48_14150 [Pedobacter sp. KR3-3]|uniref:Cyclophilin-like domain-containing protein n=1 Tax=Pedobacter albus TaxID=3113905 RepID=A0ABU7I9V2_9SPHI|nr:hypothetical protein [Pedobacter sp. KR3-3]MEE1946262.1 hypothetical protein [Pedobacter sp. KR3-3]